MNKLTKRAAQAAVSIAGIGGLLLVVPKAAHAITAALVQVVNTAANPAVTQDVSKLASQIVTLTPSPTADGVDLPPHQKTLLYQMFPNGTIAATPYVVPAGQSLVVTSMDVTGGYSGVSGVNEVGMYNAASGTIREDFYIPTQLGAASSLSFGSGLVFPPGESPGVINFGISSTDSVFGIVHGYLTAN